MRLTSWNLLHGQSLNPDEKSSFTDAAKSLGSDLLALQEIDMNLPRSGSINQSAEIAAAMAACDWGFAPTVHGTPGFSWRSLKGDELRVISSAEESSKDLYGVAIVSKVPVKQWLRLELGRSLIGMPLLIANEKGKVAPFYVKDEPRVALAAVLENGWTVINIHLSFVPFVNIYQLFKVTHWAKKLEKEHSTKIALVGDFNLPWGIPSRLTKWVRATEQLSYPSWGAKISFDYILLRGGEKVISNEFDHESQTISDHRPLSVDIDL